MEKLTQYNKMWAVLFTVLVLVALDYLGLELHTVLDAAVMMFTVWAVPNTQTGSASGDSVESQS